MLKGGIPIGKVPLVGSYQQMLFQDMLKGHVASDAMSQDCRVVPPDIAIEQLVNENILTSG